MFWAQSGMFWDDVLGYPGTVFSPIFLGHTGISQDIPRILGCSELILWDVLGCSRAINWPVISQNIPQYLGYSGTSHKLIKSAKYHLINNKIAKIHISYSLIRPAFLFFIWYSRVCTLINPTFPAILLVSIEYHHLVHVILEDFRCDCNNNICLDTLEWSSACKVALVNSDHNTI
jgi:hypothetical protein